MTPTHPAAPPVTFAAPRNYLGLPEDLSALETSAVIVLPVPYDRTTSYLPGARFGPRAIIDASRNLETYDDELDLDVSERGIHTLDELEAPAAAPDVMVGEVRAAVRWALEQDKFVVTLGGDHSVAIGALEAHAEHWPDLSIVQIDAHADLKESWEGTPLSHASVMRPMGARARRVLSIGIRSMNRDEAEFVRHHPEIEVLTVPRLRGAPGALVAGIEKLSPNVYLTIDVDGFDPSIIPATGTPEPGGLLWYEGLEIVRRLAAARRIVGFDVMELAPIPGNVASDFLVAKLIYKTLGYIAASGGAV